MCLEVGSGKAALPRPAHQRVTPAVGQQVRKSLSKHYNKDGIMFKQLLQNSLRVLRRPTVNTFQEIKSDSWQWALIYLAIGQVVAILIGMITNVLQAPAREQQRLELMQRFGQSNFTSLLSNMQNPLFTLVTGFLGIFLVIFLWVFLPYWLGLAFGGSKSFGSFAYNSSLFITPITILDSLLALTLSGLVGGLFLVLSLSLDAIRFYFVYVNLQATMGLSKGKSALVILIPVILAVILFCGLIVFFSMAMVSR